MATINSVTGPISPDDLGWTLPHEHIIVAWSGTFLDSTLRFDWDAIELDATEKLLEAKNSGISTLVDMTTIEMGRDPGMLKRLSEQSGVQIICCTGLFADKYGVPIYFSELNEEELAEIYVTEIEDGIGDSGVRAGVIKIATGGREFTDVEERIIVAAARAQVATGVPLLTHTSLGAGGERQIELLTSEGVPPSKILIGHSDVSANLRYHLRLLKKGVYVGFDRIGLHAFNSDEVRAQCIAALVRLGYASQLTMSLDNHVRWCGRPQPLTVHDRSFLELESKFFPLLKEAGVDDGHISTITVENPRRLFE